MEFNPEPGLRMLKVGIRSPTQLLLSLLDESPSHPRNTMPSSVASLIATPSDCLSTTLTRQMFLTFSHPSLSGNSLTRTGRTLPAPGGSFGRTTPSSLHSPPSVSATTTVITLQSWKTSRSTFKMSSLKSLTTIEISSSFTKLCLLQSIIATKLCVGSSPITSIDFSRNVRFLSFFSQYGLRRSNCLPCSSSSRHGLLPPWQSCAHMIFLPRPSSL